MKEKTYPGSAVAVLSLLTPGEEIDEDFLAEIQEGAEEFGLAEAFTGDEQVVKARMDELGAIVNEVRSRRRDSDESE